MNLSMRSGSVQENVDEDADCDLRLIMPLAAA
jgi:hypothetical protein